MSVQNNFSESDDPCQRRSSLYSHLGAIAFVDHNWSPKFSTAFGGSMEKCVWNSDAESASDFHQGYYALTNLLYYRQKRDGRRRVRYGRRVNFTNGYNYNDYRVQFSFKCNYGKTFVF